MKKSPDETTSTILVSLQNSNIIQKIDQQSLDNENINIDDFQDFFENNLKKFQLPLTENLSDSKKIINKYGFTKYIKIIHLQKNAINDYLFEHYSNLDFKKIYQLINTYFDDLIHFFSEHNSSIIEKNNSTIFDVISNFNDPICVVDKSLNFIYVNVESSRLWGQPPENLIGKNILDIIPDFGLSPNSKLIMEALSTDSIKEIEIFYDKNKSYFSITLYPSEDFITIFSKDITEVKKTKRALSKSDDELQQFAHIASHDLQEPLRMVKSFIQLIEKKYSSILDDKGLEYIGFVIEGAERMQSFITDLLVYSRIETRKSPLTNNSLKDIIDHSVSILKDEIEETKTTINIDSNLPTIKSDLSQLILTFKNIIENCIRYKKDNINPLITINYVDGTKYHHIYISDNGIGIEEQYFEKIFLPFKRLHSRMEKKGNGMGLAVCKKIIEKHNGLIELASKIEEGTTFKISFPK